MNSQRQRNQVGKILSKVKIPINLVDLNVSQEVEKQVRQNLKAYLIKLHTKNGLSRKSIKMVKCRNLTYMIGFSLKIHK